jgi:branched-subunit amino acid transport protein AzlD
MTQLAQLSLVLTSLAPIAFVQAAVYAQRSEWVSAASLTTAAVLMLVLSRLLFFGIRRQTNAVPKAISSVSRLDAEPLAFFVAYALPLVAAKKDEGSEFGLVAFAIVMGLVLWQQQTFQVNPLLAAMGFSFLSCKVGGAPVLLITNAGDTGDGEFMVYPLSERVWLRWVSANTPTGGGVGGFPTGDP